MINDNIMYKLLESRDRKEDPENQKRIDNSDNSQFTSTDSNVNTSTTIAQVIPVIGEFLYF